MNIYHGWFDLKPGVKDLEFVAHLSTYLDRLVADGEMVSWRLMRRKLGLGAVGREFHLMMEFESLEQLDQAFIQVSARKDPIETLHFAVNSKVQNVEFGLYRDFPDPQRESGEERF